MENEKNSDAGDYTQLILITHWLSSCVFEKKLTTSQKINPHSHHYIISNYWITVIHWLDYGEFFEEKGIEPWR